MTGKERLHNALEYKITDRPPFDFWAEDATKNRLYAYLGHNDLNVFLDKLKVDIRETNAITPSEIQVDDEIYQNIWGERYIFRNLEYGKMREDIPGALSSAKSMNDLRAFPWPKNDDFDYSLLRAECDLALEKGCAIRYGFADVWQRPALARGLENALADLYDNPEWMHYLSSLFTDFYIEDYRRAWEVSGGNIDLFMIVSDLGTQNGPLISLRMFRDFVAPYIKRLVDVIHFMGAKAIFHSCGDISIFIPDLIEIGVDVLDPIQPVGRQMQPEALAKYNGSICFHGGMDVQRLLLQGTAEEIKAQAHRYFNVLGSGYILAPTHLFQPDIPPENIIAVYESFH